MLNVVQNEQVQSRKSEKKNYSYDLYIGVIEKFCLSDMQEKFSKAIILIKIKFHTFIKHSLSSRTLLG